MLYNYVNPKFTNRENNLYNNNIKNICNYYVW